MEHIRALQTARLNKESAQKKSSKSALYNESTLTLPIKLSLLYLCKLERARDLQNEKMANESAKESDAKLKSMMKKVLNESSETKAARLERIKFVQQQRLATGSFQERAEKLESLHYNWLPSLLKRELKDLKVYTTTEMIAKK